MATFEHSILTTEAMKHIYTACVLSILLFASGCDGIEGIDPVPDYINQVPGEGCQTLAHTDLMAGSKKVGQLTVSIQNDTVLVDYETDANVFVKEIRYHIATTLNDIPQEAGVPQPALFDFDEDVRKIVLSYITGVSNYKGTLYVAAFARVAYQDEPEKDLVKLDVTRTHKLTDVSYFKATLTYPETNFCCDFQGYCLQGDQKMDETKQHEVRMLSSFATNTTLLDSVVDKQENLDLVNWIVNQERSRWPRKNGEDANGADIQMAIWKLVEGTGNPTGTYITDKFDSVTVADIVHDALTKGQGFKPACGQKKITILHKGPIRKKSARNDYNTGNYANPFFQVMGIVEPVACSDNSDECWAKGTSFNDDQAGMFFALCLD